MKRFRADLHMHTVLSPCGDLEMSPSAIIEEAKSKKLDIIGITDHNSTKNCDVTRKLGEKEGIVVMMGAEVTSKEEVHCLAFFENSEVLNEFQSFLDAKLPDIKNKVKSFGYQLVVNEKEEIIEEIDRLLLSGLTCSIDELEKEVHRLGGIFIPAHVSRPKFSIISQLGFVPSDLNFDALGISKYNSREKLFKNQSYLDECATVQSSDAHFLKDIGSVFTEFEMEEASFAELKQALRGENGRRVIY
jgi:PHP family Zn ribbon phosphoesterase